LKKVEEKKLELGKQFGNDIVEKISKLEKMEKEIFEK
jgi:hypothetical protein